MVIFECLRVMVIWNQWFCGDVARFRVCRRLAVQWSAAVGLVGFGLLNAVGWIY